MRVLVPELDNTYLGRSFHPCSGFNYTLMHLEHSVEFIPGFRALIPQPQIFLLETRQYCKNMRPIARNRGYIEAAATSDSVAALVGQMQAELRDLMARREDFARRIRYLRQVTRGLREISRAPAFTHLGEELPSSEGHGSVAASVSADRTTVSASGCRSQSSMQHKTHHVSVRLQRACRIALLEAESPVSLEEICARIVRRGSFSFVDPEYANPFLLEALNAMAECGEVQLLESAPCLRWERMAPLQESLGSRAGTG